MCVLGDHNTQTKKIGPGWIADQLENVNSFFLRLLDHLKKQNSGHWNQGLVKANSTTGAQGLGEEQLQELMLL